MHAAHTLASYIRMTGMLRGVLAKWVNCGVAPDRPASISRSPAGGRTNNDGWRRQSRYRPRTSQIFDLDGRAARHADTVARLCRRLRQQVLPKTTDARSNYDRSSHDWHANAKQYRINH